MTTPPLRLATTFDTITISMITSQHSQCYGTYPADDAGNECKFFQLFIDLCDLVREKIWVNEHT
eukprot:CAMPEP_0116017484 /NCGR_PEP_ID=MMETSP0321-20121206/8075_1 /TAXON_ID=163516 /ORGANISM="Leptocylindrus danicus var. danicus, Strain B650" /LENGTH=63 /DNA_ID=CAMNT_0003487685 /DNA_START=687 /DNA_END=878 /DNA_ORIENTATION=-